MTLPPDDFMRARWAWLGEELEREIRELRAELEGGDGPEAGSTENEEPEAAEEV